MTSVTTNTYMLKTASNIATSSAGTVYAGDVVKLSMNLLDSDKQSDAHNIAQVSKVLGYSWTDNMDVSKWIQDKYVIFPFDVYVFDEYDTTYANSNNTQRILAPASTKIPLGYYEGDDGEADDQGHWIDYGTLVALEPTDVWPGNIGNGLTNGRPADDPPTHPAGKYTWHIDAEGAYVTEVFVTPKNADTTFMRII